MLKLLLYCCKIRDHRQALLRLSALALLLETARKAFSVDVVELAKGILLIVESLVMEANESSFWAQTELSSAHSVIFDQLAGERQRFHS
jgi:E3 ubiquitin-protein ligase UBR4